MRMEKGARKVMFKEQKQNQKVCLMEADMFLGWKEETKNQGERRWLVEEIGSKPPP